MRAQLGLERMGSGLFRGNGSNRGRRGRVRPSPVKTGPARARHEADMQGEDRDSRGRRGRLVASPRTALGTFALGGPGGGREGSNGRAGARVWPRGRGSRRGCKRLANALRPGEAIVARIGPCGGGSAAMRVGPGSMLPCGADKPRDAARLRAIAPRQAPSLPGSQRSATRGQAATICGERALLPPTNRREGRSAPAGRRRVGVGFFFFELNPEAARRGDRLGGEPRFAFSPGEAFAGPAVARSDGFFAGHGPAANPAGAAATKVRVPSAGICPVHSPGGDVPRWIRRRNAHRDLQEEGGGARRAVRSGTSHIRTDWPEAGQQCGLNRDPCWRLIHSVGLPNRFMQGGKAGAARRIARPGFCGMS